MSDYRMGKRGFKIAAEALQRRWQRRKYFARWRDWLMSLYDALLRYARRFPLPLRGRVWAILLAGEKTPVYLRLGSSDGFVLEEIFVTDVYAPLSSAKLGEVGQIVDLGANAGLSVRLWRQRFPRANVIAIEPDAGNFAICKKNAGDDHVQLVQACVAAQRGKVYLDRSAEECAFTMSDVPVGEPVDALPLAEILDQCHAAQAIDILKVDIEGAEKELFADCAGWIGRVRNIMIELHPGYSMQMLRDDLRRSGADLGVQWTNETAGNPLIFLVRQPC
ncbi:MAG TPA: FkbM family methyltransferase [Tepidisphaeraceae bacterium]